MYSALMYSCIALCVYADAIPKLSKHACVATTTHEYMGAIVLAVLHNDCCA